MRFFVGSKKAESAPSIIQINHRSSHYNLLKKWYTLNKTFLYFLFIFTT